MHRIPLIILALLMCVACSNTSGTVSDADTAATYDDTAIVDEMAVTDEDMMITDTNDEALASDDLNDEATDDTTEPDDMTDEVTDPDDIFVPDEDADTASNEPCTVQFGVPNEKTGLTAEQCQPLCNCEGKFFQPPLYTEDDIAKLLAMVPVDPPAEVTEDPYDKPEEHQPVPGTVCGLFLDGAVPDGYRLETFESDVQITPFPG
ncbi:MAG TPA: hypothetical protein PKH10_09885 [bacterium]|nr:hypothetical protein [bacterium]